jgi:hypothetical protein
MSMSMLHIMLPVRSGEQSYSYFVTKLRNYLLFAVSRKVFITFK